MFEQDVLTRIVNVQWGGVQPTAIGVSRNSPTSGSEETFGATTVLIVFRPDGSEIFRVTGNYNHPESVAIGPQDRIGVGIILFPHSPPSDGKNGIIRSYTKDGALEWEVSVPAGGGGSATVPSMAFDGDGNLIVALGAIVKYSPAGAQLSSFPRPSLTKLSVDPWGNIASMGGLTLSLTGPDGSSKWSVGEAPSDLVCDGLGNTWTIYSDDTVKKFNHFGGEVLSFSVTTNGSLKSIDCDEKNQIWVKVEHPSIVGASAQGFNQDGVSIGTVTFPTPPQPSGLALTSASVISAAPRDLAWCSGFNDTGSPQIIAGWCYRVDKITGQTKVSFESTDINPAGLPTALQGRCIAKRRVGKKSAASEPQP